MLNETNQAFPRIVNPQRVGGSIRGIRSDFVLNKRNQFSRTEVGLNHPDMFSFIRLADNGDIEIMAAPGIGIVISAVTRSVSILADTLKIYTTEDDGIRWNNYSFNYAASDFTEPVLVPLRHYQTSAAYYDSQKNINDIKLLKNTTTTDQNPVTINADYNFTGPSIAEEITLEMTNEESTDLTGKEDFAMTQRLMLDSDQREVTADAGGGTAALQAEAIAAGMLPFGGQPGFSIGQSLFVKGLSLRKLGEALGLKNVANITRDQIVKQVNKRIKELVEKGYSYAQAKTQAEREVLAKARAIDAIEKGNK